MKYAKSKTLGDTALARQALKDWASNVDLNEYPQVAEFIKNKGEELSVSREQTKKIKDRNNLKKSLLDGYEDETQMQEVDPELYQKNFGEGSDWKKNGYDVEDLIYSEFNSELKYNVITAENESTNCRLESFLVFILVFFMLIPYPK